MKTFTESLHLDETSLELLGGLLGLRLYRILAPCLQVAGQEFTAPSLSFEKVAKQYIAIACKWFESPYTFADYWRLLVTEKSQPSGIEISPDGAIVAPCTINFYEAHTISSIEVHSSRWDWSDAEEEEHLEFDSHLLFNTREGARFCVWCQLNGPGIATEVHFTQDMELIARALKDTQRRFLLE